MSDGQEMVAVEGEIVAHTPRSIVASMDALTIDGLVQRVQLIQHAMKRVMKADVHYGVIPGTGKKPTLLKPGAEKLLQLFMLRPLVEESDVEVTDFEGGHRSYLVRMPIANDSGEVICHGVGECSTMESRYKWRNDPTGRPVPKEYWENRDSSLLGGPQYSVKKQGGEWVITQKVEHDNPVDYWNTALKMAKKRALVDGALTATAASDMFTQDIEDAPELYGATAAPAPQEPPKKYAEPKRGNGKAAASQQAAPDVPPPTEADAPPEAQQPDEESDAPSGTLAVGLVEDLKSKEGTKKNGETWVRFSVKLDTGEWFNTFSETDADLLREALDRRCQVEITYEATKYGKDIKGVRLIDEREVPADEADDLPF